MYFRALFATVAQSFGAYLDLYLLMALGMCSDRKELIIQDLDKYGLKRDKKFAIYDITKTNKAYYASLKENAAEDMKTLKEKYIIRKEGEEEGESEEEKKKKSTSKVAPHDHPKKQ